MTNETNDRSAKPVLDDEGNPMMLFGYPIVEGIDVGTTEHLEFGIPPDWYWQPLSAAARASLADKGLD